jgi:hypothetical protein
MAGYLIAVGAFVLPYLLAATGLGRPRTVLVAGGVLALGSVASLAATRAEDGHGHGLVPVWFLAGLVALLYVIWCGGLALGVRLRRARSR